MSRSEDFDNAFWDDPEVEDLSAPATLLYIWSWTNTRCGMAGIYRVSMRRMTECKVDAAQLPEALDELARTGFAYYEASVLWVRARAKRLRTKSPQMAKAVAKDVARLPVDHPLRLRFLEYYGDHNWLRTALAAVKRDSSAIEQLPLSIGDSVNLTRGSPEPTERFLGRGSVKAVVEEPQTVVAEDGENAEPDRTRNGVPDDSVGTVFAEWVQATGRDQARTKLTPDRRRRIEKALKSHGLDDCLAAVRHIGADAWACGENDRGRPFNDIEHALGSAKRIETWRDQQPRAAAASSNGSQARAERRARRGAALEDLMKPTEGTL